MTRFAADTSFARFSVEGMEFLVAEFEIREQISQPFQATIELASERETAFEDIIGKPGLLTLESNDNDRYIHGVVSDFSQIGMQGRFLLYRARVVPDVALLALEQDCRMFQEKRVDQIVGIILKDAGISDDLFDFRLQANYAQREYCVQYRETDLAFISRLLEAEGIFYFFEHSPDRHIMVLGDSVVAYQPISGKSDVLFNPGGQMVAEEQTISEFQRTQRLFSGKYSLQNYLFKKPALDLFASAKDRRFDNYERYDYPGEYRTNQTGNTLSMIRLQQAKLDSDVADGQGNITRFTPGFTFQLKSHDMAGFNQEYLITDIVHKGAQPQVIAERALNREGGSYGNSFSAIPSSINVRPRSITPKPVVQGVHTAIVTGPSGEEVYPDEHGRVKVHFHWDRESQKDENSSCWIRVSQLWAGDGWGAMFIPRIGQEVIVDFIEGNPDRPIITGRVYHGTNTPPYQLPEDKTRSTIKSDSTKGGGGSNEIRFEDKKGDEEFYIHGQKDWTIVIENNKDQRIGSDESSHVGNDRTKSVTKDQQETIGKDKTIHVGANHTETIGANHSLTVGANKTETVGALSTETVAVAKALTVGGAYQVSVGAALNETVGAAKAEEVGAAKSVIVGGGLSYAVGAGLRMSIGGQHSEEVEKAYDLKAKKVRIIADDEIVFKTGSAKLSMRKNGAITIQGKDIVVKGSGSVTVKGSKIKEN